MKAYFNGSWVENKITLPLNDRVLQFGDGIFETMIYQHGKINYLSDHLSRIKDGLEALNLDALPLTKEGLYGQVTELLKKNAISGPARIKMILWRKNLKQNAYSSFERQANLLLLASRCDPIDLKIINTVGYADTVRNVESQTSPFKTLSSIPYILAAQERDKKDMEELILLDIEGNLSECIASNLFWIRDDEVYTPALSTGCINGIMRRQMSKWCEDLGTPLNQVIEKPKTLKNADHVFCINVAGISIFDRIGSTQYTTKGQVLDQIVQHVLDPS